MEQTGLFQRKHNKESSCSKNPVSLPTVGTNLTLMEEVYLLGLKDNDGYVSFWNTSMSSGLRGCILTELALLGRIELEQVSLKRKKLPSRIVKVISDESTEDVILDEALKNIKNADKPESLQSWLDYFNAESWNPLKMKYIIKNVRERIAKNLVDKGILTNSKESYLIFDLITHPLANPTAKMKLVSKLHNSLLKNFVNDPQRMDLRILALIYMAQICDVLDQGLECLDDEAFTVATCRIDELMELDFEVESLRDYAPDVLWGVVYAFLS